MKVKRLHRWDISYERMKQVQEDLMEKIELKPLEGEPEIVAGADVAYSKKLDLSFGAVIIFDYPSFGIINKYTAYEDTTIPYVPGLLTFREAPVLLSILKRVTESVDLFVFDGQGIAHPRKMGLASHLGLLVEKPTIGCAKSKFVGEYGDLEQERGDYSYLECERGVCGAALRTRTNVKPVYVSPGYLITLDESIDIILNANSGYRIPIPTRLADKEVAKIKEEVMDRD